MKKCRFLHCIPILNIALYSKTVCGFNYDFMNLCVKKQRFLLRIAMLDGFSNITLSTNCLCLSG